MDTKSISITVVFAALATALNPVFSRIAVPAPFFPFISYQIWQIPIIAAFLMMGPKYGVSAALVSGAILIAFSPGPVSLGDVSACLSMLLGIFVATKLLNRKNPQGTKPSGRKSIIYYLTFGIAFRILIMAILDYTIFLRPIVGVSLEEPVIIAVIFLVALFNATEPLYTIPIGYFIAKTVGKNLKVGKEI